MASWSGWGNSRTQALAQTTMTSSPFNQVPNELLTDIFTLSLPEPSEEDATITNEDSMRSIPPRNLLRVCRRWRSIVESTPRLWSQWAVYLPLRLDRATDQMVTHFLKQCMARSGDSPLSFYMFPSSVPLADFQRILLSTQHRWKRVRLDNPPFSIDAAQLALAPLSELELSCQNKWV